MPPMTRGNTNTFATCVAIWAAIGFAPRIGTEIPTTQATAVNFLNKLDFKEYVRVKKTRIKTQHTHTKLGKLKICIESVEHLGDFIEVESITEDNTNGELVQKKLFELLTSLDISERDRVMTGYDTLMYYKKRE